jgi:hypothetical protein
MAPKSYGYFDLLLGKRASRNIASHTKVMRDGADICVKCYDTIIVRYKSNGRIVLSYGEYKTRMTKERINEFSPVRVTQDKNIWWVHVDSVNKDSLVFFGNDSIFYNGMVVDMNKGMILKPKLKEDKHTVLLKKWIKRYCDKLKGLDTVPLPDNSDCWLCMLHDSNGKHVVDKGCLESHLKEQYIHGTLIVNALTDNHIDRPDIVWRSNLRDIMVRSVRRYFKKYLCI